MGSIVNTDQTSELLHRPNADFEQWLNELSRLATEDQVLWLLDSTGRAHQTSYNNGLSPFDEIQLLNQLAEWKGCGCSGN